jgi:hypothetical protein
LTLGETNNGLGGGGVNREIAAVAGVSFFPAKLTCRGLVNTIFKVRTYVKDGCLTVLVCKIDNSADSPKPSGQ